MPSRLHAQTLGAEATAVAYSSAHFNNQMESRYRLFVNHRSKADKLLQYGLSLDFWGIIPQQTSDWFDVREIFVGLHSSNVSLRLASLRLGRILPDWAKDEIDGPLQKIFPIFIIDPLTKIQDGMVGIYGQYQKSFFGVEALYSPLFVPNRGGVRFEKDSDGHLSSISRWLPPLFEEIKVGEGVIPVHYSLHLPSIKEIVLQQGGWLRISLQTERIRFAALGANYLNPEPMLRPDAKLHIKDESLLQAIVHLHPKFIREQLLGFQSGVNIGDIELFYDGAYVDRESAFKNMTGVRIRTNRRLLSQWTIAALFTKNLSNTAISPSPIPARPEEKLFSKIDLTPSIASQLSLSCETDLSMRQRILRGAITLGPFTQMKFGIGFDVVSGEKQTYWGMFRANDRIWMKGSYVF